MKLVMTVKMQDAIESKEAMKEETHILSLRWLEFSLFFLLFPMFI
jgi:hypothetical protein